MSVIESKSTSIEQLAINTIRTLAMDAVQAANSGHPGTPMALAPVAYTLWQRDPALRPGAARCGRAATGSCSRAAMRRCCSIRCCTWRGVKQLDQNGKPTGELAVPLEDIKKFRQLHSRTPGHPEHFETTGVETTTGPLGQGCGNSVGMAIAQRWLAAHFNRPGFELFDYNVYVLCSDGDLMEGVVERGRVARRPSEARRTCAGSTTTTTSRSKAHTELAFSEDVGHAVRGPRLERGQGGRRQRPRRDLRAAYQEVPSDATTSRR